MSKSTNKDEKQPMTFMEILNSEYKSIIEAIEHGSSDPEIMEWLKQDLFEKTGFRYQD